MTQVAPPMLFVIPHSRPSGLETSRDLRPIRHRQHPPHPSRQHPSNRATSQQVRYLDAMTLPASAHEKDLKTRLETTLRDRLETPQRPYSTTQPTGRTQELP